MIAGFGNVIVVTASGLATVVVVVFASLIFPNPFTFFSMLGRIELTEAINLVIKFFFFFLVVTGSCVGIEVFGTGSAVAISAVEVGSVVCISIDGDVWFFSNLCFARQAKKWATPSPYILSVGIEVFGTGSAVAISAVEVGSSMTGFGNVIVFSSSDVGIEVFGTGSAVAISAVEVGSVVCISIDGDVWFFSNLCFARQAKKWATPSPYILSVGIEVFGTGSAVAISAVVWGFGNVMVVTAFGGGIQVLVSCSGVWSANDVFGTWGVTSVVKLLVVESMRVSINFFVDIGSNCWPIRGDLLTTIRDSELFSFFGVNSCIIGLYSSAFSIWTIVRGPCFKKDNGSGLNLVSNTDESDFGPNVPLYFFRAWTLRLKVECGKSIFTKSQKGGTSIAGFGNAMVVPCSGVGR